MKQSFGQKGAGGRFLALALALIMLCSVLVPAYAAAVDEQGAVENQNEPVPGVTYGVIYIFHVGETVYQQVKVLSGSVLTKPADPTPEEGKVFACWRLADGQEFTSFGTEVSTTKDETVALYAYFVDAQPAGEAPAAQAPAQDPAAEPKAEETTPEESTPEEPKPEEPKTDEPVAPVTPETPSITIPAEETTEPPETPETAPLTAQDYLDKIALYQADYNVLNLNKQLGLTTDEAYAESCQSLCLSLGDLLVQAADAQAAGTLTEDEFAQIELTAETLLAEVGQSIGADQPEVLTTRYFNFTLNNIDLAYIYYVGTDSANRTKRDFTGNSASLTANDNIRDGRMLFFLKPKEGYLLTDWRGTDGKAFDFYSIDTEASRTKIKQFADLQSIVDEMQRQGYIGYFGFSTDALTANFNCTLTGEKPTMEIEANTTQNNVMPGETATFEVTITPERTTAVYDVEKLEIIELTINRKGIDAAGGVSYGKPVKNDDGTYTLTVTYPVTDEDFANGTVNLYVKASIEYKKTFTTSDRAGLKSDITTGTAVVKEATKPIPIVSNPRYIVSYEPAGVTPSDSVREKTKAPVVDKKLSAGEMHTVLGYDDKYLVDDEYVVEDEVNKGTWKFDGWYLNSPNGDEIAPGTEYEMKTAQVTFYGKWTFTPNTVSVTIKKHVDGNMGDKAKQFKFTYTIKDKDENDITPKAEAGEETAPNVFYLVDGGQKTLSDIPIGATITITEEENSAYKTSWSYTKPDPENAEKTVTVEQTGASLEFTVEKGMSDILCTNKNDITPDTGIFLDSWPYFVALTLVAAGAALLFARRRRDAD